MSEENIAIINSEQNQEDQQETDQLEQIGQPEQEIPKENVEANILNENEQNIQNDEQQTQDILSAQDMDQNPEQCTDIQDRQDDSIENQEQQQEKQEQIQEEEEVQESEIQENQQQNPELLSEQQIEQVKIINKKQPNENNEEEQQLENIENNEINQQKEEQLQIESEEEELQEQDTLLDNQQTQNIPDQNIIQETQNKTQEAENITQEALNITQEAQSITQEAQSITQEAENITQEVQNITQEEQQVQENQYEQEEQNVQENEEESEQLIQNQVGEQENQEQYNQEQENQELDENQTEQINSEQQNVIIEAQKENIIQTQVEQEKNNQIDTNYTLDNLQQLNEENLEQETEKIVEKLKAAEKEQQELNKLINEIENTDTSSSKNQKDTESANKIYEEQVTQQDQNNAIDNNNIRKQTFQQSYFKQIIDVSEQLASGNMIPALIALKEKYQEVDQIDQYGFNLLHHCATNNFRDIAIFLLKNKANVDFRNTLNQTPIMMTCNYGWMELTKLFLDYGAEINIKDQFSFSPLLYALKANSHAIFYYLLYKGANLNDYDGNMSGVAHWCAYNNNYFLLGFLKTLKNDLNFLDNENKSPLIRAIENTAYQSITYLANTYPQSIPSQEELDTITKSQSINKILREAKQKYELSINEKYLKIKKFVTENVKYVTLVAYIFGLMLIGSILAYSNHNASHYHEDTAFISVNIIFYLMLFQWFGLVYFLVFQIPNKPGEGKHIVSDEFIDRQMKLKEEQEENMQPYLKGLNLNEFQHLDFKHVYKITNTSPVFTQSVPMNNDFENPVNTCHLQPQNINFLQEIAILFEAGKYSALKSYDYNRVCSCCLKYQQPGTAHCAEWNTCVPYYSHFSFWFNKCIYVENWMCYFLLVVFQQFMLSVFVILIIRNHWTKLNSSLFFMPFEAAYYMYFHESFLNALGYILSFVFLYLNTIDFCFEIYGIMYDMTRNEILNIDKYRYFYYPAINLKGQIVNKRRGLQNPKIKFWRAALHTKLQ